MEKKTFKHVFVLCSGRTGSVSLIEACRLIDNYTSGHETRSRELGDSRLNYPSEHIEADNRLVWFLGELENRYGKDAFYVHLTRDEKKTAESYFKRIHIRNSAVRAFAEGVYLTPLEKFSKEEKKQVCLDYVQTVNKNIRLFLKDKPHKMEIRLADFDKDFPVFWKMIGAKGDFEVAIKALGQKHNASGKAKIKMGIRYKIKLFLLRLMDRLHLK